MRYSLFIQFALAGAVAFAFHTESARAADGLFDPDFAATGRIAFDGDYTTSANSAAAHIVAEPNGNLLVSGDVRLSDGFTTYPWLGELTSGGQFVLTFGASDGSGRRTLCQLSYCDSGSQYLNASMMDLQGDGRIVFVSSPVIGRLTASAHALDTAGVTGGLGHVAVNNVIVNDVQGKLYGPASAALLAGGGALVVGGGTYSGVSSYGSFAIIKLATDLSLDTNFNAVKDAANVTFAGGQIIDFGSAAGVEAVHVLGNGHILLIGRQGNTIALAQLDGSGALDLNFGGGTGKVAHGWAPGILAGYNDSYARLFNQGSTLIDRGDRIVVATSGLATGHSTTGIAVVRFAPDGSPDPTFGASGIAFIENLPPCTNGVASYGIAIDSAGRILATGTCSTASATYFVVIRLHGDDGSLDTNFGSNGFSLGAFSAASTNNIGRAITFDLAGRPIIVGQAAAPSAFSKSGVARLTYDLVFANNLEAVPPGRLSGQ